ncbi:MAG: hypothetical protein JXA57_06025, partial [Armatimonadetes bacterium]|nr:hypothetical protein [Armatimonadota bacterium]
FTLWRGQRLLASTLLLGAVLLSVWVLDWGEISDSKVWLIPVGVVLSLFGGMGLSGLTRFASRLRGGKYVAVLPVLFICVLLLRANWDRSDLSNVWLYRDRWAAVLAQLDEHAIFLAEFDVPMFATDYLQQVEGVRTDVTLLRPQDLWHEWYVSLMYDDELRESSLVSWERVNSEIAIDRSNTPQFWQGTAMLSSYLGQHYEGRRTVYALHGSVTEPIPPPPYFLGLSEDLVRLDFELPRLLIPFEQDPQPLAEFPGELQLLSFDTAHREAEAGELVGFRARWRTTSPLSGEMFGVRLQPKSKELPAGWERLSKKGRFTQGFPVVYGLRGLAASPAGTVYEQEANFIVPSNAPTGEYEVQVGFAPSYPPEYQDWCGSGRTLSVQSSPLPTNDP